MNAVRFALVLLLLVQVRNAQAVVVQSLPTRAVFQRNDVNQAAVPIEGTFTELNVTSIEARAVPRPGFSGAATSWQQIDGAPLGGIFNGSLNTSAGWYDVQVRSMNGATAIQTQTVERIGVGEVFITAGQSNSANHGAPTQQPSDDRVLALIVAGGNWQVANDPQPVATGTGGSPWPAMGDQLAERHDVPVGFYSVGWGGTRVDQWLPGGSLYPRLKSAVEHFGPNGVRAILWHQGESDTLAGTSAAVYQQRLESVISQSRTDAGFDVPWGIALVSYISGNFDQDIINGQLATIDDDPLAFQGPNTDLLLGSTWRIGVHFNAAGLTEHGQQWDDAIHGAGVISVVPEPSSFLLAVLGLLSLLGLRRRRVG